MHKWALAHLKGSVFDHINLDLYWGPEVSSQTQWCFYLIWLQSIAGDIGIAVIFLGWTRFEFAALTLMPYCVECCVKKANKT